MSSNWNQRTTSIKNIQKLLFPTALFCSSPFLYLQIFWCNFSWSSIKFWYTRGLNRMLRNTAHTTNGRINAVYNSCCRKETGEQSFIHLRLSSHSLLPLVWRSFWEVVLDWWLYKLVAFVFLWKFEELEQDPPMTRDRIYCSQKNGETIIHSTLPLDCFISYLLAGTSIL
jgi:hypothetical protein